MALSQAWFRGSTHPSAIITLPLWSKGIFTGRIQPFGSRSATATSTNTNTHTNPTITDQESSHPQHANSNKQRASTTAQVAAAQDPFTIYYPGAKQSRYTTKLTVVHAKRRQPVPTFRILNEHGELCKDAEDIGDSVHLGKDKMLDVYKTMVRTRVMDELLYSAQRQGRISFYMTSSGEEAAVAASAAALDMKDQVFSQYREQAVLMWRGYTYESFCNQCFGNALDKGKGRQMPIHYGEKELYFHTVSSPLATQLPQAAGAAYALRLQHMQRMKKRQAELMNKVAAATSVAPEAQVDEKASLPSTSTPIQMPVPLVVDPMDNIVAAFFGEGAASEGDFHAALNFASTMNCPVLFVCRNNGFAISTPTSEQYAGDGIVLRGLGYGMDALRVDGNDALAVFEAVRQARKHITEFHTPVLLELMTYRQGHHSTSDDSTRYRHKQEIETFHSRADPIRRLSNYLTTKQWWTESMDAEFVKTERSKVLDAVKKAESADHVHPMTLFDDVYHQLTPALLEQRKDLHAHLLRYPEVYRAAVHDVTV